MEEIVGSVFGVIGSINKVLWSDWAFVVLVGAGLLFTIWTKFSQFRVLGHGVAVTRGLYDDPKDPGAINHFQALSAALSATVGLGNIGGVALAIGIGGPGALFWMWVIGFLGMALKTIEITLAMMYRNMDDPENPSGGAMWVIDKALGSRGGGWKTLAKVLGVLFCITLMISSFSGGNMFQAWNVADLTNLYFGVPQIGTGIVLVVLVGLVIIGGIKRIGNVAGKLVPIMCVLYVLAALAVVVMHVGEIPEMLAMIVRLAFTDTEATGAFLGGTVGSAFAVGVQRALFSNEAGQGSAPIAHAAARTSEPAREGIVGGLGPFIDTIIICTLTALVIIATGTWKRDALGPLAGDVKMEYVASVDAATGHTVWGPSLTAPTDAHALPELPSWEEWYPGSQVFLVVTAYDEGGMDLNLAGAPALAAAGVTPTAQSALVARIGGASGPILSWDDVVALPGVGAADVAALKAAGFTLDRVRSRIMARLKTVEGSDKAVLAWEAAPPGAMWVNGDDGQPDLRVYRDFKGATLTSHAFDVAFPGLGKWLVTLSAWLFALSTMISWSYYGEQGAVYIFGKRSVLGYRLVFLFFTMIGPIAVTTDSELGDIADFGTGFMLWANMPIVISMGYLAVRNIDDYFRRLKAGEFKTRDQIVRESAADGDR